MYSSPRRRALSIKRAPKSCLCLLSQHVTLCWGVRVRRAAGAHRATFHSGGAPGRVEVPCWAEVQPTRLFDLCLVCFNHLVCNLAAFILKHSRALFPCRMQCTLRFWVCMREVPLNPYLLGPGPCKALGTTINRPSNKSTVAVMWACPLEWATDLRTTRPMMSRWHIQALTPFHVRR